MTQQPMPSDCRGFGTLKQPDAIEQREVMGRWQRLAGGMEGERTTHLDRPDNPVAYKLLDAAGEAIARRQVQAGISIMKLVVSAL